MDRLQVDRHTGQILWRLGGKHSDFTLGAGVRFAWQHNPLPAGENTIRLFDNESDGSDQVSPQSRVIWIHLDNDNREATLVNAVTHPRGISVQSQGNAQALENGDVFVGWGQRGVVSEFDSQGKLLFNAFLPPSYDTYRAYRAEWAGQPDTEPTATARTNADGTTTVHAIWNGATAVTAWRILAGKDANTLALIRTAAVERPRHDPHDRRGAAASRGPGRRRARQRHRHVEAGSRRLKSKPTTASINSSRGVPALLPVGGGERGEIRERRDSNPRPPA